MTLGRGGALVGVGAPTNNETAAPPDKRDFCPNNDVTASPQLVFRQQN
jgi:hypothetical protein